MLSFLLSGEISPILSVSYAETIFIGLNLGRQLDAAVLEKKKTFSNPLLF
jgi:hypothetical protein